MDPQDEVIKIVDGTGHGAEDLQVLVSRKVFIEIRFFNNSAHPGEDDTAIPVEVFPKDFDRADGRPQEREDHPDRRALPRAIWSEKTEDISPVNPNIYILRSPPLPKLLA